MTDQAQQEQGEMILAALSEAVHSRHREPMRLAMGDAGRFLLSAREGMADGSHDPLICAKGFRPDPRIGICTKVRLAMNHQKRLPRSLLLAWERIDAAWSRENLSLPKRKKELCRAVAR